MFEVLVVRARRSPSDEGTGFAIEDRLAVMRVPGLGLSDTSAETINAFLTVGPQDHPESAVLQRLTGDPSMAKLQYEAKDAPVAASVAPPLSASVRRHLGQTLRSFYAASLSEPVSERMEALLARLDRPKG